MHVCMYIYMYIYTYRELFPTLTAIRRKQILLCESQFVLCHE